MKATFLRSGWFCGLALALIVVLLYAPGLSGSFLFDDRTSITDNLSLRLFDGSIASLFAASTNGVASPLGRPLSMASFALNLYFFGDGPFSFKFVNLIIHLANGVLVFFLMRSLLTRAMGNNARAQLAALWASAVWLIHPINLTAVLFAVQRMTSLAAFFTLLALLLYLHGRESGGNRGRLAIGAALLVCWPLGILSKETAVLLPLFILVLEWLALQSFRSIAPRNLVLAALIASLAMAGLLAGGWDFATAGYRYREFGLLERLMTETRVLWFYLLQLLLPLPDFFGLYHDDIPVSRGLLSPPGTLLAIAGWGILTGLALYRHKQAPLACIALFWFLAAHMLESTILPLEIAYEHRNYLATLGILIWLASMLFAANHDRQRQRAGLAVALGFLLLCGFVTSMRAMQWGDEYRRTTAEAAAHPRSARANYSAGVEIVKATFLSGRGGSMLAYDAAHAHFERSTELDRSGKVGLVGTLYLDCLAGKRKNPAAEQKLRERFSTAPFGPADLGLIHDLSDLLVNKRLCLDDAEVDLLLQAALTNPKATGLFRGMLYAVAMDYALAKKGSLPLATEYARKAVASNPGNVPLRVNLIRLLMAAGNVGAAGSEYAALTGLPVAPVDRATVLALQTQLKNMERNANGH